VDPVEPPDDPDVVLGAPPDGLPDVLPLLPLGPERPDGDAGPWLGGVGHPCGRGVPPWPESEGEPAGSPDEPDWLPSEPCCDPSEPCCESCEPWLPPPPEEPPDGKLDGLEGLDDPELPLGDDGVCGPDPPLPPDEDGDEGDDEDDPPEGDGMPLGIELDVVVLQPASVTATAKASSVEKPGKRCMVGPSACARSDENRRRFLLGCAVRPTVHCRF
jgi:hypothetical protein